MVRLSERMSLVALGAFVLLDAVLVAAAVSRTRPEASAAVSAKGAGAAVVRPSAQAGPEPIPTGPEAGGSETARAGKRIEPAPLTVGIVAIGPESAWRFTTGSCDGEGSTVAVTGNGGKTWRPRAAPFDVTTRVRVRPNGTAFAVGGDDATNCRPAIRQSKADAAQWGAGAGVTDAWYRDPRDPAAVGTASGRSAKPCGSGAVIDLAVTDTEAAALCAGGRIMTSATGKAWEPAATVEGALSLAASASGRRLAAVTGMAGCDGVAVVAVEKPDEVIGCADADLGNVEDGQVSLSVAADAAWLLAGEQAFRSSGDLSSWSTG